MIDSKLLDSSVIIEYLHNKKFIDLIESDLRNYISIATIFEIKKKLLREGKDKETILEILNFLKQRLILLDLDCELIEFSAELSYKNNLPSFDSIIYATALKYKLELVTTDNDFRGLDKVKIL